MMLSTLIFITLGSLSAGMAVLGIWLAANHTYEEDGEIKTLILYGLREGIEKIALWLDNQPIARAFKLAGIGGTTGVLLVWFLTMAYKTGDLNYLAGLFLSVGFLAIPYSYRQTVDMLLSCYRCMPTFWLGFPSVIYTSVLGSSDPVYFWGYGVTIAAIGIASATSSILYYDYANKKTSVAMNKAIAYRNEAKGKLLTAEMKRVDAERIELESNNYLQQIKDKVQ